MIRRMKKRMSLSVDVRTADYLGERAARETGGNVSALVDQLVGRLQLEAALAAEAHWYAGHPDVVEDAEAERYAA